MLSEDDHRAQLNLIEGAALSGTVTRFAPSEYGWDYEGAAKQSVFFYYYFPHSIFQPEHYSIVSNAPTRS